MIEVIPFMLFILGWHPDRPGEIDLQRPEILFETVEQCEETGVQMAARMTDAALDKSGAHYAHRCLAVPSFAEFDALFSQSPQPDQ